MVLLNQTKWMMMKKIFLVFFLITWLFCSGFTFLQEDITIDWLQIELWPEYDREDMLVIYRFSLSSDVSLPAKMEIHIPYQAGDPYKVAMQDIDGLLYRLDYSIRIENEWVIISFTTPSPDVQIEFYDPRLQISDMQRSYNFKWFGDYAIKSCSLNIKEPLNATKLQSVPLTAPGVGVLGTQQNYEAQLGAIEAGENFFVRLTYQKPDNLLVSSLEESVQPVSPINDQISGRTSLKEIMPWVFGMVGIVLIFSAVFLYYRMNKAPNTQADETVKPASPMDYSDLDPSAVYCHRCGKRAVKGDIFCRICGEKLRVE
jgi:hypothetical protein